MDRNREPPGDTVKVGDMIRGKLCRDLDLEGDGFRSYARMLDDERFISRIVNEENKFVGFLEQDEFGVILEFEDVEPPPEWARIITSSGKVGWLLIDYTEVICEDR